MRVRRLPPAGLPPADALRLQRWLAAKVCARGSLRGRLRLVAAVHAAASPDGHLHAVAVLCEGPTWRVVDEASASGPCGPRSLAGPTPADEAPLVLEALRKLPGRPQVLLVHGHGRLHPRRLGLASQVGLQVEVPTAGVATALQVGTHQRPGTRRGDWVEVTDHGQRLGVALTTQAGARPVYVSVGHRIGLLPAARIVLACATRQRLPEPLRHAARRSRRLARAAGGARRGS